MTVDGDHWQLAQPFPDGATLAAVAADDATVWRARALKLSNVGFSLLGAVVEVVTGRSYSDHVRSAVLEPFGLTATTPDVDPGDVADHATGYTSLAYAPDRIPFEHIATAAMAAATGFSSTATDLVRWAAAHFPGDERVLSDDAKRQMQRTEWTVAGAGEYGLGLEIGKVGERRVVGPQRRLPRFHHPHVVGPGRAPRRGGAHERCRRAGVRAGRRRPAPRRAGQSRGW